jgi:hypothetical protein
MILRDIVVLRVRVGGRGEFQCPWDKVVGERFKGFFDGRNRRDFMTIRNDMARNERKPPKAAPAIRGLAQGRPNGETCGEPLVPEKPRKIFFDLA